MNEYSERLRLAMDYLKDHRIIRTQAEVAERCGKTRQAVNSMLHGSIVPSMDFLLTFCDNYPINFWWLRNGSGAMLLERLSSVKKLRDKNESLRKQVTALQEEVTALRKRLGEE